MARTSARRLRTAVAAIATASALVLVSCSNGSDAEEQTNSSAAAAETITVRDNHGEQVIETPVEKVVVTDNRSFEILDNWGVKIAAAPKPLVPFTIPDYKDDESIEDLGTHREPKLEVLAAVEPDLVVNGQRFRQHYDDIKALVPDAAIVEFEPRDGEPLDEELRRHAKGLGEVFGKQAEADALIADFDAAIERARKAYDPSKTVMALNSSGGTLGYIAPGKGRTFGPIFDLIGLKPALEVEGSSDDHEGDEVSVEAIAGSNPDFILVMDRDAGTNTRNTDEFRPAQSVVNDAAPLRNVTAVKEGHIYYAPEDTYTNESIITYTEILNQIADLFENA